MVLIALLLAMLATMKTRPNTIPSRQAVLDHAESVQVTFDESVLPAETLLDLYFLIHDPTTKDRQGNDVGPQYRSAMFYADDAQKASFAAAMERAAEHYDNPLVTELSQLEAFYPAEPEHQDYFAQNPAQGYCQAIISPKVSKARAAYRDLFKS